MDSQESSGGGATLYIIVFLLCVISAVVGYFQFTLGSQRAEAERKMKEIQTESERKMKEIQAKAEADMASAKSEEEKREIERKAQIESDRVKMKAQADSERAKMKAQTDSERATMKAQTDAEKKALAAREAKIKAAEAAVNKRLADAAARVKNAQNLQNQAKAAKTDADNKKQAADAAMAKAVASGKAVDKKLADEKKRLADEAQRKVNAANANAAQAAAQARAEANKALDLKKQYDQLNKRANMVIGTLVRLNAVPGYYKDGKTIVWGGEGPKTHDPRVCQQWAAKSGYPAWGHRTADHPDPNWKNSCFGYKEVRARHDVGRHGDEAHIVGCTFSDLRPDQIVCPSGSAKAVAVEGMAKAVAVPQASPALQNEARALVQKFPTIQERYDYPGHDIVHHGFSGNIPREAIIKHCLSDCVNRGCDCAAVTFSSDFRHCWLKNENAIKNRKPRGANDRATLIKPARVVFSGRAGRRKKTTRYC